MKFLILVAVFLASCATSEKNFDRNAKVCEAMCEKYGYAVSKVYQGWGVKCECER